MELEKNEGKVHILINCPIATFLKEKQHSEMDERGAACQGEKTMPGRRIHAWLVGSEQPRRLQDKITHIFWSIECFPTLRY